MPLNMQEVFVQEVWRVGSDSVYWVRREASFAIGALAKVVPLEMVETYLVSDRLRFCSTAILNSHIASLV